ncbi:hypothetical protein [Telmatospirillum sp.]|uniref:hypothetical protein n=1 Tax=Telmatospirillum sp. TaxID=2079197 RepID=UPI002847C722|nr:hypothetical protein [Telmatospirillum sp.]MDR3437524.1 hypothetical protein [Telmatospirillum sp.]
MDSERERPCDEFGVPLRAEQMGRHRLALAGRFTQILAFAFGGTLMLQGCDGTVYPPYRYKETVVVETPEGIRTGSSVIEVRMVKRAFGHEISVLPGEFKGQAVVVDLPGDRKMFALLTSKTDRAWALKAYQYLIPQQPFDGDLSLEKSPEYRQYQLAMALKGPQVVSRDRKVVGGIGTESGYPTMVRFRNINDTATVEEVDPDNLSKSFGAGYRFKSVILEKTDEPVSEGLDKQMRWMGQSPEPPLNYPTNPYDRRFAVSLSRGDFSTYGRFFRGS